MTNYTLNAMCLFQPLIIKKLSKTQVLKKVDLENTPRKSPTTHIVIIR